MSSNHRTQSAKALVSLAFRCLAVCLVPACDQLLGLDDYHVQATQPVSGSNAMAQVPDAAATTAPGCMKHQDCMTFASQLAEPSARDASVCVKSTGTCVKLLSDACQKVTGDYRDDQAIFLGTLFSTSGAQGSVNRAREQSVILAVDEINQLGGIPSAAPATEARRLVLVSCDEADLRGAGRHLVNDLRVPAIIGPNTSQDTLDLSNDLTIAAGTLVMSPTAVASSIADLIDADLTWQMVPSDVQRVPLMIHEINRLELELRVARKSASLKLAVIYRDDALGEGTRVALNALTWNGKALADPSNLEMQVRIRPYNPSGVEPALIDSMRQFAPDVVVLVGTAEAITQGMVPLERGWTAPNRPEYVLIESEKTPELLEAVAGDASLRRRIRGTGALPAARSAQINQAFIVSYTARHPDEASDLFGMGPAYDATYAIAFSIAALRGGMISGSTIARTLPLLASGGMDVELQSSKTLSAFRALAEGSPISVIGTTAPLRWDARGAVVDGTIELWCISEAGGKPGYDSSGVSSDLASDVIQGKYVQCAP